MRRAVVPPALVLGLLLSGCGGGEGSNAALMTEVESMSADPDAQEIESFAVGVFVPDLQALLDSDDPFNEFYDLAEDYGLEDCAL